MSKICQRYHIRTKYEEKGASYPELQASSDAATRVPAFATSSHSRHREGGEVDAASQPTETDQLTPHNTDSKQASQVSNNPESSDVEVTKVDRMRKLRLQCRDRHRKKSLAGRIGSDEHLCTSRTSLFMYKILKHCSAVYGFGNLCVISLLIAWTLHNPSTIAGARIASG